MNNMKALSMVMAFGQTGDPMGILFIGTYMYRQAPMN